MGQLGIEPTTDGLWVLRYLTSNKKRQLTTTKIRERNGIYVFVDEWEKLLIVAIDSPKIPPPNKDSKNISILKTQKFLQNIISQRKTPIRNYYAGP